MSERFRDMFDDWQDDEGPPDEFDEVDRIEPRRLDEKEVRVVGVYEHQESGIPPQFFVLLQDNRGRRVPIWIGKYEALSISMALEGDVPDRPMTHDLLKNVIERMGGTVERIIVDDLWQSTFYAKITIVRNGESIEIDSRPSDAIALALRTRSPIYVAEPVFESIADAM
jgi:bifunctional DNase/RNase